MAKGRAHIARYVGLKYRLLESPAWRSLPCTARALYLEIAKRYNGRNNSRIPYGLRQAYRDLHISKTTASRALQLLQDRGFIVCTKKGSFSWKTVRDASEWRVTEYSNDFPPEHASKEFMSWRPSEPESNEPPASRTRVPRQDRRGTQARPYGYPGETVNPENYPHGYSGGTVNTEKEPLTGTEAGHIQLPGAACSLVGGERSAPEGSAVASSPPNWHQIGYPAGSPSREDHLAALERRARERGRRAPGRR
jgi:hypothetical protein